MRSLLVAFAIAASLVTGLSAAAAQGAQTGIDEFCGNAHPSVTEDSAYC